MVTIELRGPLARYGCEHGKVGNVGNIGSIGSIGKIEMTVEAGRSTVGEILKQIPIPQQHVGLVSVNGKKGYWETLLHDGDKLIIFPVVSGG